MQLTRFTDLGLRVLMYLTQHEGEEPATNRAIAEVFQVPHNHVIKVVHRLGQLGWIHTQRGRNGGLRLALAPEHLRLGQICRELESVDALVDCDAPPCVLKGRCLIQHALNKGLEAFYQKLDEFTLADVEKSRTASVLLELRRKHAPARV